MPAKKSFRRGQYRGKCKRKAIKISHFDRPGSESRAPAVDNFTLLKHCCFRQGVISHKETPLKTITTSDNIP